MVKLRFLFIILIVALISYLSWMMTKSKPLDHIPEKAKLVLMLHRIDRSGNHEA